MGTNYETVKRCDHYHHEERLHIGKSSYGWCFALNTHPEHGINDLEDWRKKFAEPGITIVDEYGDLIEAVDMLKEITERQGDGRSRSGNATCELGPSGLQRSRIDGRHCIAHGPGTWDIMRGEFS